MGIRTRFIEALTGKISEKQCQHERNAESNERLTRENIKARNKELVDQLRQAIDYGASQEVIDELSKNCLRSYEFNQVIGALHKDGGMAVFQTILKANENCDMDEKSYKELWNRASMAQEDCDRFFDRHGVGLMRNWVMAQSLKDLSESTTWEFVNKIMNSLDENWEDFRKGEWWIIAWSFLVADEVEKRYGPASCTSEKFDAMWEELYSKEAVSEYINNLKLTEIANFKCTEYAALLNR